MTTLARDGGQVGRDLDDVDWDSTPLGPPKLWPQSLRTAVDIMLGSRFPMWMAWGPELTMFCNQAYRPILGKKYPWALGRPTSEVWSEIWDAIMPRIDRVMATGESTWDERLPLFLERSGYVEETYFTFSYSPLADDDGGIAGLLCVVKEDTEEVVASRRMMTVRDLGTRSSELTKTETIATAREHLAGNPHCLPFTMTYLFAPDGETAELAATTGFVQAHPAAPPVLSATDPDPVWPVGSLAMGTGVLVDRIDERFPDLPCGAWVDPPKQAFVVPLQQPRQLSPYGFLVVGLNRHRPLDEGYRAFLDLVAGQLASALTDARAFEFEKQRAESLALIDQAKTDFFTNVSHEFRTPLTLVLGPVEDALADLEEPLPPRQRERVEVVHRNAQRLLKLVNSVLDFSALESGQLIRPEAVDLAAYTAELASLFVPAAQRVGIQLVVDCPPLPSLVHVDPEHWAKIVSNLLSNALKFTLEGGIELSLRVEGHEAVLDVRDSGGGIPEDQLEHLFERFHRVPGARSRTHEGSGIGLALVAELTAAHDGTVTVHSTVGAGTTFTVRVPLRAGLSLSAPALPPPSGGRAAALASGYLAETMRWSDPAGPTSASDPACPAVAAGPQGTRPRILVVEDNADMREYIARLLAPKHDVEVAGDGLEALDKARALRPDLIVTDVMMPRLDGFGLLEALHAEPTTTGIPVVMLSARAGEEGTVEGLEAGADDYLAKPFSARELLARVRVNLELDRTRRVSAALGRSQALLDQAQRLAQVGSWEVDLVAQSVTASDEALRLLGQDRDEFESLVALDAIETTVHPDERPQVYAAFGGASDGRAMNLEARILAPDSERLVCLRSEVVLDDAGAPRTLRGSIQDVTEQRRAEQALAVSAAREEAAAREHAIADELQRSLLPVRSFDLEHLDVATYYRAGVEGTQVGGDWYDVIELGPGRTALVVGDVMGRGVSAASRMGQLRSAVRAYAKLDLPPAEILEHLDSLVQEFGDDQIVTCVYATFDSTDQTLFYASAGHLPSLLVSPGEPVTKLDVSGPPLGAGVFDLTTEKIILAPDTTVVFYTDGLVERRGRDLDIGIDTLTAVLRDHVHEAVTGLSDVLVEALLHEGPDDDVAVLVARVGSQPFDAAVSHHLGGDETVPGRARRLVRAQLREWDPHAAVVDDVELLASELVTNALRHGRPPIDLRLRLMGSEVVLEVQDRGVYRPRRRQAGNDDEGGRGLQIVEALAAAWGSRATGTGKSVWCSVVLPAAPPAAPSDLPLSG